MKPLAAACAGLAAWFSLGTIGLVQGASADARVALLPSLWLLPMAVGVAYSIIRLLRLSPSQVSPVFGSALVLLPWLPFPVPPAALLWTGPCIVVVWAAVVATVVLARWPQVRSPWLTGARRAPLVAATIALTLYGASAWWLAPLLPDGDSPHYMILAQSLVKDGDLQIENNHRRADYLEYSLQAAQPDYLRRGVNGAIYSIHAPGLPAIIAPAVWLFGYPGAVAFLGVVAALSTALVWRLSYLVTGSASAAWFGWASCALTAPFFFQATQVFPDGFAATCVLLGTLPLTLANQCTAPGTDDGEHRSQDMALWLVSGASLAILPWLQTRLAILAAASALCVCLRMRNSRQFLAFAAIPAASAAAWFAFFYVVYGTPDPTAPYGPLTQTSMANLGHGVPGILFDQQFGLFPNAPVYGVVFAGFVAGAAKLRRWAWETLALIVPYAIGVGMYQHWWGGASPPARLLAPMSLAVSVAGSRAWRDARTPATRAVYCAALAASIAMTTALAGPEGGRLLFNFRDGIALWAEWGNDLVDLPRGLPSLFVDDPLHALSKAAIWVSCGLVGWFALRVFNGRPVDAAGRERGALLALSTIWCVALSAMVALTLVWRIGGVPALTPASAELGLLHRSWIRRPLAYEFGERRFLSSRDVLSRVRIRSDVQRRPVTPAPLLSVRAVPDGTYRLHVVSPAAAEGTLTLRVGDTSLPLWTSPAPSVQQRPDELPIRLPVGVRSILVEGDGPAARSISSVELERVTSEDDVISTRESARRGVGYAPGQAFFMDDNAYPEPTGFWVAGGRAAETVIASASQGLDLFLRNAPVENAVTIDIDGERHELTLGPGEERMTTWPRARLGPYAMVRITSRSGFRPSAAEPGNRDLRYLGCWVEVR